MWNAIRPRPSVSTPNKAMPSAPAQPAIPISRQSAMRANTRRVITPWVRSQSGSEGSSVWLMAGHCAARPGQGKRDCDGEEQGLRNGIETPAMRRGEQQQGAEIDKASEQD